MESGLIESGPAPIRIGLQPVSLRHTCAVGTVLCSRRVVPNTGTYSVQIHEGLIVFNVAFCRKSLTIQNKTKS